MLSHRYGHLGAAKNVQSQLLDDGHQVSIHMYDSVRAPGVSDLIEMIHLKKFEDPEYYTNKIRSMDGFSVGTTPAQKELFLKSTNTANQWRLLSIIERENPHVIVVTSPSFLVPLKILKDLGHIQGIPVGWVVTDFHSSHFLQRTMSDYADVVFSPSRDWINEALSYGASKDKFVLSGIPTPKNLFSTKHMFEQARTHYLNEFDFEDRYPIVGFAGGSSGAGPLLARLKSILEETHAKPLQLIVFCGNNQKLFDEVQKLSQKNYGQLRLKAVGYRKDFLAIGHVLLTALYTKAGGLTLAEATMLKIPLLLDSKTVGAESGNLAFFVKKRMAHILGDSKDRSFAQEFLSIVHSKERLMDLAKAYDPYLKTLAPQELYSWIKGQDQPGVFLSEKDFAKTKSLRKEAYRIALKALARDCRIYLQLAAKSFKM